MRHAHSHTHADGTQHGHFHVHEDGSEDQARTAEGRAAHKAETHEHEHTTRKLVIPVTFDVGSLEEIGLGGFKVGWIDAEQDGRNFSLTAGAGVGSPYLEGSVTGGGQPSVYAQADIRDLARELWNALRQAQGDAAAVEELNKA